MGKRLEKRRNRTEEQEKLLREVRRYHIYIDSRTALVNRVHAGLRTAAIDKAQHDQIIAEHAAPLRKEADALMRRLVKTLAGRPVWEQWLRWVPGIGDNLGVQWVAYLQPIGDFPTVSHLWAYCGYDVEIGADGQGHARRRERGKQGNWVPRLRTLGYQTAESFEKMPKGPYRERLYDAYKRRDRERHPEPVVVMNVKTGKAKKDRRGNNLKMYTDGHIRNRALRYTVKIFLSHLWQVWRELEGLPVRGPYPIEVLGHTTFYSPWSFIERPDDATTEGQAEAVHVDDEQLEAVSV